MNTRDTNQDEHQTFSEETMQSLRELGEVLSRLHARLISEGYTICDGKFTKPSTQHASRDKA